MALLSIILVPVLPALSQAGANQHYAILRRQAQGHAVTLALEVRESPGDAPQIIQRIADERLIYRVSLVSIGGTAAEYTAGDISKIAPSEGIRFQTGFEDLFNGGTFVIAEVFDSNGHLAGMSLAKIN